jgi:hypothetical protein
MSLVAHDIRLFAVAVVDGFPSGLLLTITKISEASHSEGAFFAIEEPPLVEWNVPQEHES